MLGLNRPQSNLSGDWDGFKTAGKCSGLKGYLEIDKVNHLIEHESFECFRNTKEV